MSSPPEPLETPRPPLRIAFAGTPEFAVPTLQRLDALGELALVLTQPDRPAGRGRKPAASPVKQAAAALGLRVAQPAKLREPALLDQWGLKPDLVVVVAYGLLLPVWMLAWPRIACINLHASLLPRWRGAAPIQHAILAGDAETGISVMRMDAGLDRGPVYATAPVPIERCTSAGRLHDRLARLAADLLEQVLPRICDGTLRAVAQDDALATFAPKISKSDAALDWRLSAARLERQVRAYDPWPVAEASTEDGRRLRIWEAETLADRTDADPGAVVATSAAGIDVATGDGVLRLKRIQPPSSVVMDAAAYLAAHRLDGARFAR